MSLLLTKEVLCSIQHMKEEKNFLVYFWLPIGTYHKNLEIWNLFLKSSKFGSLFLWFFFCIGQNHVKILQNFSSKRNAYGSLYKHLALKGALGEPISPTLLA